jgi:hypothetical protein
MDNRVYRKIWENKHGEIPRDNQGRSYEIHHINGNHSDNRIENLQLVTIEEHYNIHFEQGDYGACHLIAQRMLQSPSELSKKISELNKLRVGELNPFYGKTHTEETKSILSEKNSGENNFWYGKKRPEHAKKVSDALSGVKKTKEHCNALSKAKKGMLCKQYKWKIKKGDDIFTITNLKNFCREKNISHSKLYRKVETDGYLLLGRVL